MRFALALPMQRRAGRHRFLCNVATPPFCHCKVLTDARIVSYFNYKRSFTRAVLKRNELAAALRNEMASGILHGGKLGINLRMGAFMDRSPPERSPPGVIEAVQANWELLKQKWDELYPDNPVEGTDDEST